MQMSLFMLLNVFATNRYYVHTVVEETEEEGKTVLLLCVVLLFLHEFKFKINSKNMIQLELHNIDTTCDLKPLERPVSSSFID